MKSIFKSKVMMVVICLVCVITVLMIPTLVLASDTVDSAQNGIQPRWSYLWHCDNGIDYANNISKGLWIYGSTQAYYDYYAEVEIQLQKYVSGIWVDVPTYSWSSYPEDSYAEIEEDDVSVSSGTYRFSIIHTAYTTSGVPLESDGFNSLEITIR